MYALNALSICIKQVIALVHIAEKNSKNHTHQKLIRKCSLKSKTLMKKNSKPIKNGLLKKVNGMEKKVWQLKSCSEICTCLWKIQKVVITVRNSRPDIVGKCFSHWITIQDLPGNTYILSSISSTPAIESGEWLSQNLPSSCADLIMALLLWLQLFISSPGPKCRESRSSIDFGAREKEKLTCM